MRPTLSFYVVGLPKGQPRAKARAFGKFAQVYNPKTADEWKLYIREAANRAWDKIQWQGAVSVKATFYFPRPKAHFRSQKNTVGEVLKDGAPIHHISRPDADNLAKSLYDALTNLGIWRDDAQVAAGTIAKRYVSFGQQPGAQVEIKGCD